jgi:hypothetical protein
MQTSIFAFTRKGPAEDREARLAADNAKRQRRTERLAFLELPWPRPSKMPGRPSRQELWEKEPYNLIEAEEAIPEGVLRPVPLWWRPGLPLVRDVVDEACSAIDTVEEERHHKAMEEECGDEAVGEKEEAVDEEPPAKKTRTLVRVDEQAKKFMLDYITVQNNRKGWDFATCVRNLQALAPEVYGHLHVDTPRKWKLQKAAHAGHRPRKVPDGALLRLCEVSVDEHISAARSAAGGDQADGD